MPDILLNVRGAQQVNKADKNPCSLEIIKKSQEGIF
jgi:hypothetical protein